MIANVKNSYRKWLNDLPLDDYPSRWRRIRKFVECIYSTNNIETILKDYEKSELSEGFNVMEEMLDTPNHEDELYCICKQQWKN